jgi:RHS repeat-associated protein
VGELTDELIIVNGLIDPYRKVHYDYDNLGRLIRQTGSDPDGDGPRLSQVTEFGYDAVGNQTQITVHADNGETRVSDFEYDALNRMWRSQGPLVAAIGLRPETKHVFDQLGRETNTLELVAANTYRDTEIVYDDQNRIHQVSLPAPIPDAVRPTTTTLYDENGNLTSVTDPRGNTATIEYDELNREIRRTEPATLDHIAPVTETHYYQDGSVSSTTLYVDHPSRERTFGATYDAVGRLKSEIMPIPEAGSASPSQSTTYDAQGRLLSTTDVEGNLTQFTPDGLNRTTLVTRSDLTTSETRYNTYGVVSKTIDFLKNEVDYVYDFSNRLLDTVLPSPDGISARPISRNEYDRLGNLTASIANITTASETDAERTEYVYNEMNWLTQVIDGNQDSTYFEYDILGRQTKVTDAVGNITEFNYDNLDRVTSEEVTINSSQFDRTYFYDDSGNLLRNVDRDGTVKVYQYDEHNRRTNEDWYEDENAEALDTKAYSLQITYDVTGRPIAFDDDNSNYYHTYDNLNRLKDVGITFDGDTIVMSNVYATDNFSRLDNLRVSLIGNIGGITDFENTYSYDENLRLTTIEQTRNDLNIGAPITTKRVEFDYDANDRIDFIHRYSDGNSPVTSNFGYDNISRLTSLSHTSGDDTFASYSWQFDAAHRVENFTSNDGAVAYDYDDRGQLASADYDYGNMDEAYSYDENGNRLNYTIDDLNRIANDGTHTYEYSKEGNREKRTNDSTGKVTEYEWDIRNQLRKITTRVSDGGSINSVVEYVYDMFGRRIAKEFDDDGDGAADRNQQFVYDGQHIALQLEDGELSHRYLHGPAIDQILADEQVDAAGGTSDVLWPLADNLGSVRDIVDFDSNGDPSVVNHINYDAFGNIVSETNTAIDHIFGYTGRETDEESDLNYYRARYYDAGIGQFVSEDPIGFTGGDPNTRRYVGNSPTNAVDPSGLEQLPNTQRARLNRLEREELQRNVDNDAPTLQNALRVIENRDGISRRKIDKKLMSGQLDIQLIRPDFGGDIVADAPFFDTPPPNFGTPLLESVDLLIPDRNAYFYSETQRIRFLRVQMPIKLPPRAPKTQLATAATNISVYSESVRRVFPRRAGVFGNLETAESLFEKTILNSGGQIPNNALEVSVETGRFIVAPEAIFQADSRNFDGAGSQISDLTELSTFVKYFPANRTGGEIRVAVFRFYRGRFRSLGQLSEKFVKKFGKRPHFSQGSSFKRSPGPAVDLFGDPTIRYSSPTVKGSNNFAYGKLQISERAPSFFGLKKNAPISYVVVTMDSKTGSQEAIRVVVYPISSRDSRAIDWLVAVRSATHEWIPLKDSMKELPNGLENYPNKLTTK